MARVADLGAGARRIGAAAKLGALLGALACWSGCTLTTDDGADGSSGSGGSSSQGGSKAQGGKAQGGKASAGAASGGSPSSPVESDFPDAQVYVDAHNAVRAAVQEPAGYSGVWQPVPPVAWSDAVAATSQEWANHLRDAEDCGLEHARDTGYGENLAAGTNVGAERAVEMWASEIEDYTYSPEYTFSSGTGHYTQIVWRKTTHIGCASARCSRSTVVVCRYSPPGNYLGQQIY